MNAFTKDKEIMKVKVGDEVYDSAEEPVMVELTDQDKKNIRDMDPECTKYAMYPDAAFEDREAVLEWMEAG